MAKARALDKRRKSVRNIRKITRTMEMIAAARFKKAMDRATAATAYTQRMTRLVGDLMQSGLDVSHPLLEPREETRNAILLVLTANRGLCGGYNGSVLRAAMIRCRELQSEFDNVRLEVSGKRGISAMRFRQIRIDEPFTQFEDKPAFVEVRPIAERYLKSFVTEQLDRVDVAYTKFFSGSRQDAVVETLLPLGDLPGTSEAVEEKPLRAGELTYEFLPSAESILEEVVPTSFKLRLFKCFLDAAVSEQIARRIAMKSATENAQDMIRQLSMTYNRARQTQITNEILEVVGGAEALTG
jgi:F-type H+-transporting ATPase subunit gamma